MTFPTFPVCKKFNTSLTYYSPPFLLVENRVKCLTLAPSTLVENSQWNVKFLATGKLGNVIFCPMITPTTRFEMLSVFLVTRWEGFVQLRSSASVTSNLMDEQICNYMYQLQHNLTCSSLCAVLCINSEIAYIEMYFKDIDCMLQVVSLDTFISSICHVGNRNRSYSARRRS